MQCTIFYFFIFAGEALSLNNSSYLFRANMAVSSLTSEDRGIIPDGTITLPPVGHLVGLLDRLAGGIHSDRMFY